MVFYEHLGEGGCAHTLCLVTAMLVPAATVDD